MSALTWPEYRRCVETGSPILLPVGAVEQHGLHLPLGTDWMTVTEVCRRVAVEIEGIVAAPIAYGCRSYVRTGGGDGFPGTVNLRATTLIQLVREVLAELIRHGARRILVVNGHFENEWFVREACDLAARDASSLDEDLRILMLSWWELEDPEYVQSLYPGEGPLRADLQHAAWLETSLGLHLFPGLVRLDLDLPDEQAQFPPYDVFPQRPGLAPASGSLSPVTGSSAEAGRALAAHYVERIAAAARTGLEL